MKIVIAGDYCEKYRVLKYLNGGGRPFENIKPLLRKADFSFINFEMPVVNPNHGETPIWKCGPNFSGHTISIDIICDAGFNVTTLANNHILDQGYDSLLYTIEQLNNKGVKTVGAGENLEAANKPLILRNSRNESLGIINCCEHEFSVATESKAGACPLNPIQQWYRIQTLREVVDGIVVIVHGGNEYYQLPSPRMKETYRFFIDAGADAVVNHHQHCYSGFEIYKGKPIFYGLGNFLFDLPTQKHTNWNEGYIVELEFLKGRSPMMNIHPYTQCNEEPIVSVMNDEEKSDFNRKLYKINEIIADDRLLMEAFEVECHKQSKTYQSIFEPYDFRPLSFLYWHGLLPSFVTKKKMARILNYINCEAHLDRLRFILGLIK